MIVTFHASLEGPSCIKYDGDGSCQVKLSIPASEIANVTKLLAFRETLLEVSVKPDTRKELKV